MKKLLLALAFTAFCLIFISIVGLTEEQKESPKTAGAESLVPLGATVYASRCGTCHYQRLPNTRSDSEWEVIVLHMRSRSQLTGKETRAVLEYLKAANEPPAK